MADGEFPVDTELTAVAIGYRNRNLIADLVMPRLLVSKKNFTYSRYNMADGFTIPDTRVGSKSEPNMAEFGGVQIPGVTADYGLQDSISNDAIKDAPPNIKPLDTAVEMLTALIELDKEVRTAGVVFNAASYASGFKETLSGTGQFSDYTNSDPVDKIVGILDSMLIRPNTMVIGRAAFSKLARHPKILAAVGKLASGGIATREEIAAVFELTNGIIVGEGFVNTARKGQTPVMVRVWGKHISLFYQENAALTQAGLPTFCFRAAYGDKIAGQLPNPRMGLRGGVDVRSGESVVEVICSDILGYFIQNAVA